jgi:hypothetical protein
MLNSVDLKKNIVIYFLYTDNNVKNTAYLAMVWILDKTYLSNFHFVKCLKNEQIYFI